MKCKRQEVSSGTPWEATVGYSRAVRVGRHVFVSGTTASDENGQTMFVGDACRQATVILAKIGAALAEVGATVRYHGRPAFVLEREESTHEVVRLSWLVNKAPVLEWTVSACFKVVFRGFSSTQSRMHGMIPIQHSVSPLARRSPDNSKN